MRRPDPGDLPGPGHPIGIPHRRGALAINEEAVLRTSRVFHAVDSHTEGMPTRVITGGVGVLPGATMAERRAWFIAHRDEPRSCS